MNYKDQANLIWGNKWNWHGTMKFEGLAADIFPTIRDNMRTDAIVLWNFIQYFLFKAGLPSQFDDAPCNFMGCEYNAEGHVHFNEKGASYNDRNTHTIQEWVGMVRTNDYFLELLEHWKNVQFSMPRRFSEPVSAPGMPWDGLEFEMDTAFEYESREIPQSGNVPILSYFHYCNWWDTIRLYPNGEKDSPIKGIWFSSERPEDLILVVDPRIPKLRPDHFKKVKDEADQMHGKEIIISAGDWAKRLIPDDSEFQKYSQEWIILRTLLIDHIQDSESPLTIPRVSESFDQAVFHWNKAKEHIDNRNYSEAMGKCYIACEEIFRSEFNRGNGNAGSDPSLRKIVDGNKLEIIRRYEYITYLDLGEIIKKRHSRGAAHPADKKPTLPEADDIYNRTKSVINRLYKWRINNVRNPI